MQQPQLQAVFPKQSAHRCDCKSNARVADCLCYDDVNDGRDSVRALLEESSRNMTKNAIFDDGQGAIQSALQVLLPITHYD